MGFDIGNIFDDVRNTVTNGFDGVGDFFNSWESGLGSGDSGGGLGATGTSAGGALKSDSSKASASTLPSLNSLNIGLDRLSRSKFQSTPTRAIQSEDPEKNDMQWIDRMRRLALISREDTKVNISDFKSR